MSQDTLKLFKWMAEHLQEIQQYNDSKFIPQDKVLDFHSWFIYETNLRKLCKKIDPEISVLIGNFSNILYLQNILNKNLGKLIKELLKQGFLFSVSDTGDNEKGIDIEITYDIETEAQL